MKKLFYILITLMVFIPLSFVKALDYEDYLPSSINTSEGVVLYPDEDGYVATVDGTYSELNLVLGTYSNVIVEGSSKFILDNGYNEQKVRFYIVEEDSGISSCDINSCPEYVVAKLKVYRISKDGEGVGLEDLKVVGADLKFLKENEHYTVEVPSNMDEIYIEATPSSESSKVTGTGVIKLDKKVTSVTINVENAFFGNKTYTVNIRKKSINTLYIVIIALLVIGFIAYFIYSKKSSLKTINKNDLKSDLNSIDKEKIMKGVIINPEKKEEKEAPKVQETPPQEEKKEESVASNLGSNLVQARPMITPEEK